MVDAFSGDRVEDVGGTVDMPNLPELSGPGSSSEVLEVE